MQATCSAGRTLKHARPLAPSLARWDHAAVMSRRLPRHHAIALFHPQPIGLSAPCGWVRAPSQPSAGFASRSKQRPNPPKGAAATPAPGSCASRRTPILGTASAQRSGPAPTALPCLPHAPARARSVTRTRACAALRTICRQTTAVDTTAQWQRAPPPPSTARYALAVEALAPLRRASTWPHVRWRSRRRRTLVRTRLRRTPTARARCSSHARVCGRPPRLRRPPR